MCFVVPSIQVLADLDALIWFLDPSWIGRLDDRARNVFRRLRARVVAASHGPMVICRRFAGELRDKKLALLPMQTGKLIFFCIFNESFRIKQLDELRICLFCNQFYNRVSM
jgi:hypothetical protein